MRRSALRVACAVSFVTAVVAIVAGSSAVPATKTPASITSTPIEVTPVSEHRFPASMTSWAIGQRVYYWGELSSKTVNYNGTYRAECVWLGEEIIDQHTETRLDCTIWLRLLKGTLVAEGQVTRPAGSALLGGSSTPTLAITGGTAQFNAAGGWIDLQTQPASIQITQAS
jgi:hypothetical protein